MQGILCLFVINKLEQKKVDFSLIYSGTSDGFLVKIIKYWFIKKPQNEIIKTENQFISNGVFSSKIH